MDNNQNNNLYNTKIEDNKDIKNLDIYNAVNEPQTQQCEIKLEQSINQQEKKQVNTNTKERTNIKKKIAIVIIIIDAHIFYMVCGLALVWGFFGFIGYSLQGLSHGPNENSLIIYIIEHEMLLWPIFLPALIFMIVSFILVKKQL